MSDKEVSDFSINRVECPHCQAVWINGQHYWSTGATGNEIDLAGLVCNTPHGSAEKCINPQIGAEGGDTWAARMKYFKELQEETKEQ
jgi:hypothetical protein